MNFGTVATDAYTSTVKYFLYYLISSMYLQEILFIIVNQDLANGFFFLETHASLRQWGSLWWFTGCFVNFFSEKTRVIFRHMSITRRSHIYKLNFIVILLCDQRGGDSVIPGRKHIYQPVITGLVFLELNYVILPTWEWGEAFKASVQNIPFCIFYKMKDEDISRNGSVELPVQGLLRKTLTYGFTGNFWGRLFKFETDGVSFIQI